MQRVRFVFGFGTSGSRWVLFRFSCVVHFVSPDRAAVVTIHHSSQEKRQAQSSADTGEEARRAMAGAFPFL